MWKLFEKALGRTETEEPVPDSRQPKQDSGFERPSAGAGNGGAMSVAGAGLKEERLRDGTMRDEKMRDDGVRDTKPGADQTAGNTPQDLPGGPQPAVGLDPAVNPGSAASPSTDPAELEGKIKAAMRTVYDPEIPINIYELGLVYGLQIEPEGKVHVQMTLTAPSCPEAQTLPARVQQVVQEVPGVSEATVELVWEPTWTPQKMSEAARLQLGIF